MLAVKGDESHKTRGEKTVTVVICLETGTSSLYHILCRQIELELMI